MIFRWSGAVTYDAEQVRERLQGYFEAIGYRCVQREPELMLRRGSLWHGFVSASPRRILIGVVAKTQLWGMHTLVDVEFYIFQRGRSWRALDAQLLVEEAREMIRYLQEGEADFEKLEQLDRCAIRHAWQATLLTLMVGALLSLPLTAMLLALQIPFPSSALMGGAAGVLIASFLGRFRIQRRE